MLTLTQTDEDVWEATWKQPVRDGRKLNLQPSLPDDCIPITQPDLILSNDAAYSRWKVQCDLRSGKIVVDGLENTLTDVFVRIEWLERDVKTHLLRADAREIDLSEELSSSFLTILKSGVEHILLGPDHLLFVLGIFMLLERRKLIWAVTSFTIAHSVTLIASSMGLIAIESRVVEILIAASIVTIAIEVLRAKQDNTGLTYRYYPVIIFVIGLLHGLGFAGAVAEMGFASDARLLPVLAFNLGIELGQIAFVLALLGLTTLARWLVPKVEGYGTLVAAYAVGATGCWWMAERIWS